MNFKECLKKGLIKKDPTAVERVNKSLEISERFLSAALKNYEIEEFEIVELAAYNSAFHSARALLFAKGLTERNHHCLFMAVRELYKDKEEIADMMITLDRIRLIRHNVQYGGATVDKEDAEFVLRFAERLLRIVKSTLKVQ